MMEDRRSRQKGACSRCHERKVKCDILLSESSCCSACRRDDAQCVLRGRKPYTSSKRSLRTNYTSTLDRSSPLQAKRPSKAQTPADVQRETNHRATRTLPIGPTTVKGTRQDLAYILQKTRSQSPSVKICHIVFHRSMAKYVDPDELEFLNKKGVFSLPPQTVCDELVQCYLRYLYPILPIIDPVDFVSSYEQAGLQGLNLLLLWAVFHAGASYISDQGLALTGHSLRRDLKATYFQRAKRLFDAGNERDFTILVQAALLLSTGCPGSRDVLHAWTWTATAISFAQSLGLHRDPLKDPQPAELSPRQHSLWLRLFWTCFVRDRWTAFVFGRPVRINLDDCDAPQPSDRILSTDYDTLSPQLRARYSLDFDWSGHWRCLLRLTLYLDEIMTHSYRPGNQPLSYQRIQLLETDLQRTIGPQLNVPTATMDITFMTDHLRLHKETAIIALHRKAAAKADKSQISTTSSPKERRRGDARDKVNTAARNCHAIVEHMVEIGSVPLMTPMLISLAVPSMQTYLTEMRSVGSTPLARNISMSRLDYWIQLMAQLEHNYPLAEFVRVLFQDARGNVTASSDDPPLSQDYQDPTTTFEGAQNLLEGLLNINWDSTPESLD